MWRPLRIMHCKRGWWAGCSRPLFGIFWWSDCGTVLNSQVLRRVCIFEVLALSWMNWKVCQHWTELPWMKSCCLSAKWWLKTEKKAATNFLLWFVVEAEIYFLLLVPCTALMSFNHPVLYLMSRVKLLQIHILDIGTHRTQLAYCP